MMREYAKTKIENVLSISTIVTVYYLNLDQTGSGGESHDFWELIYVDKGELQVFVDGYFHHLKAGQMTLYAPGEYHSGPPVSGSVAIVSFDCDSRLMDFFRKKVIRLSDSQRELLMQIILMGTEHFRSVPPESGMRGMLPDERMENFEIQFMGSLLEGLLLDLYRTNRSNPERLEAANQYNYKRQQFEALTAYMKDHLDTTLSREELSDVLGVSVSKLKLLFRQQGASGPIAYFNAMKIAEAKRMICETSLNMTQISESLGFTSVHYFSKLFKKTAGQTPTEFAKSVQTNHRPLLSDKTKF